MFSKDIGPEIFNDIKGIIIDMQNLTVKKHQPLGKGHFASVCVGEIKKVSKILKNEENNEIAVKVIKTKSGMRVIQVYIVKVFHTSSYWRSI